MKKKLFIFLTIIVLGAILAWFINGFFTKNQYSNKLPTVPDLTDTSTSFKSYINQTHEKALEDPSAINFGVLGMVYQSNNYTDEAKKCYELAIETNPKDWRWSYFLGCLNQELGDSEAAITYFKNVLDVNISAYMAMYHLAEAYQQTNQTKKAEDIFKTLSGMNKRNFFYKNTKRSSFFPLPTYANLQLAKLYLNENKLDEAKTVLEKLIKSQITFGPAYRQMSFLYAEKEDKEKSSYYSERSNDLHMYTNPVDTLLDKMSLYSRNESYLLKQIDDAARSSNTAWALELATLGVNKMPDSKYLLSKAIKQFMDMSAARRAVPYLEKHLNYFGDNYQELIEVGSGLASLGLKDEAQKYFLKAEKIEAQKIETKSTLAGMLYEKVGMKEKALELTETLLNENPENVEVLKNATFLYIQLEDLDKAKQYLTQLKKVAPLNENIHVFEGILAEKNGNSIKSIKHFKQAFSQSPDKNFTLNRLTDYYKKNKKWDKLIELYKRALKEKPNDSSIQEAYGTLLLNCPDKNLRNLKLAKEYSERAFINYVYNPQTRVAAGKSLAQSYFELGDKKTAIFYINQIIKIAQVSYLPRETVISLQKLAQEFKKG